MALMQLSLSQLIAQVAAARMHIHAVQSRMLCRRRSFQLLPLPLPVLPRFRRQPRNMLSCTEVAMMLAIRAYIREAWVLDIP
jgi:hypothetical protein